LLFEYIDVLLHRASQKFLVAPPFKVIYSNDRQ
jgi:hypothetical protein